MKKVRLILNFISTYRIWMITLASVDLLFTFFAWLAYPEIFHSLVGLMVFITLAAFIVPLVILCRRHKKAEEAFQHFIMEPDEENEYLLCEIVPVLFRPYVYELGRYLRAQQAVLDEHDIQLADYEEYIEKWVHEIKKPLSLMTLLLDNRKNELSPLVHTRMLYVRDHVRQNVEQILYFSRLGAVHKDYFLEPLLIFNICREAVEDNQTLLDEANFMVEFHGKEVEVVSDKKGLMFILGQIISNSVKYSGQKNNSLLCFTAKENGENTILSIKDNGPGIPPSDLPFIFDKGFTGDRGGYLSRSTGMGLFLVKRMADDLGIGVEANSSKGCGTELSLRFPKVERRKGEDAE